MKKKVLFVINPISGGKNKGPVQHGIEKEIDRGLFEVEFVYTEGRDHARKLALAAAAEGYAYIAAVGGDGTVNEVARGILEHARAAGSGYADGTGAPGGNGSGRFYEGGNDLKSKLAIVPSGSGNGLARYLNIPMRVRQAVQLINRQKTGRIDSGSLNGQLFFCVAGTGFDAHISMEFARDKRRGFWGYAKMALQEISAYKPAHYLIRADGHELHERAFLVSIANSSQYGNNAYIAPGASASDGMLDVCVLKPFPAYLYPEMAIRLMNKSIHRSPYMRIVRAKEVSITRPGEAPVHLDGEPQQMGNVLDIRVIPASLELVVP